jgi:pimeloyl-ACP methyl ester carboxylesterase
MAAIIFIHGAGDSAAVWERQTAAFSKDHEILAVDLPGHGARLSENGLDSHNKNAAEVCRLMDAHKIDRAVVVGHSMGGGVAMMLGLNHPERVQALVLVATGARLKMRPEFMEQARKTAEEFGNRMPGSTHIIPAEQMVHPGVPAEIVDWLKRNIGKASAQATYADFQANNSFDVMSRLSEIKAPTLVVGGSDDRMAPLKFTEFLANAIPGARMEILTPSGHYPQVEQEESFNRQLEAFLSGILADAGA